MQLSTQHKTGTHALNHFDVDETRHARSGAVICFAQRCEIGIVFEPGGNAKPLAEVDGRITVAPGRLGPDLQVWPVWIGRASWQPTGTAPGNDGHGQPDNSAH